ncbi:MAG: hypothetical protein COS88_01600, partial [Chloroflexi bacterium CG07_land_8_20_14_0_80_51_10]
IGKTAQFSKIRLARGRRLVSLDSLYPVAGWMAGYEEYRFRSYIFAPGPFQKEVAEAAKRVLGTHNISVDFDLSMQLAKWG